MSSLAINDGVLIISGRRERPLRDGRRYEHIEIDYGPFERRIVIGEGFDADAAEATTTAASSRSRCR